MTPAAPSPISSASTPTAPSPSTNSAPPLEDPSRAILQGIAELSTGPIDLTHGSTVATNAVLERKGARIALLVTAGFRDLLLIARQTRRELYNFLVEAPKPLVDPSLTFEVAERLTHSGEVLTPLTSQEIERLITLLKDAEVTSVAICLLHSYAHPQHEQALATALSAAGFAVSASHAVLPEYREYERFSTTTVNAYVTPLMSAYLTRLESASLATEANLSNSPHHAIERRQHLRHAPPKPPPSRPFFPALPPASSAHRPSPPPAATPASSPLTWAEPPPT